MTIRKCVVFIVAVFAVASPARPLDVRPSVTSVTDQRTTGQSLSHLEINVKLVGDDAGSVRGIRTTIGDAVDDTGRSVLPDDDKCQFEAVQETGSGQPSLTLKLKNPARRATVLKEIRGELQLFLPDRDPGATVLVSDFLNSVGKPLTEPSLVRAGIIVTVMTKKEFELAKRSKERARE